MACGSHSGFNKAPDDSGGAAEDAFSSLKRLPARVGKTHVAANLGEVSIRVAEWPSVPFDTFQVSFEQGILRAVGPSGRRRLTRTAPPFR
ncbi:hypothetical protein BLTE_30270 [Blastochloris tepida]|uniref:Uncharacterized protein n=1 Tax=Blastochloris tepida TaxID=2233851 RepID=A0A348G459_9HYPH|nr:hypothetical protein BLTE_30270 [Blastochloris tepida]